MTLSRDPPIKRTETHNPESKEKGGREAEVNKNVKLKLGKTNAKKEAYKIREEKAHIKNENE